VDSSEISDNDNSLNENDDEVDTPEMEYQPLVDHLIKSKESDYLPWSDPTLLHNSTMELDISLPGESSKIQSAIVEQQNFNEITDPNISGKLKQMITASTPVLPSHKISSRMEDFTWRNSPVIPEKKIEHEDANKETPLRLSQYCSNIIIKTSVYTCKKTINTIKSSIAK